jgi:hypothetical protein
LLFPRRTKSESNITTFEGRRRAFLRFELLKKSQLNVTPAPTYPTASLTKFRKSLILLVSLKICVFVNLFTLRPIYSYTYLLVGNLQCWSLFCLSSINIVFIILSYACCCISLLATPTWQRISAGGNFNTCSLFVSLFVFVSVCLFLFVHLSFVFGCSIDLFLCLSFLLYLVYLLTSSFCVLWLFFSIKWQIRHTCKNISVSEKTKQMMTGLHNFLLYFKKNNLDHSCYCIYWKI